MPPVGVEKEEACISTTSRPLGRLRATNVERSSSRRGSCSGATATATAPTTTAFVDVGEFWARLCSRGPAASRGQEPPGHHISSSCIDSCVPRHELAPRLRELDFTAAHAPTSIGQHSPAFLRLEEALSHRSRPRILPAQSSTARRLCPDCRHV